MLWRRPSCTARSRIAGRKVASCVRVTTPLSVSPASSRYAAGRRRAIGSAGDGGRYSPPGSGSARSAGGGPSRTRIALAALNTRQARSARSSGGRAQRADLGVAGDARPARAVPPRQRPHQRVVLLMGAGLQDAALAGQQAEVGLGHPAAQGTEVGRRAPPRCRTPRTGSAASRRWPLIGRLSVSRSSRARCSSRCSQPVSCRGSSARPCRKMRWAARSRASHVHVEAQDAVTSVSRTVESTVFIVSLGLARGSTAQHASRARPPVWVV